MLIGFIIMVVIIVLIVKLSYVEKQNIELLSEKCRNEVYEEYKKKSTKFLRNELFEISEEYHRKLDYYKKRFREDYGSECVTPFGFDNEKCENGARGYMRYDKDDMRLFHTYQVISEILDRRNKGD